MNLGAGEDIALASSGRSAAAAEFFERANDIVRVDHGLTHARLREAAAYILNNDTDVAAATIREFMEAHGRRPEALRLLAETHIRTGRPDLAEPILEECVTQAPSFRAARFSYANALFLLNKVDRSLEELEVLLSMAPKDPLFRKLKMAVLEAKGAFAEAADCALSLVRDYPDAGEAWMRYGHALRVLGQSEQAVAAYRKSIALAPEHGPSYWSLANLKTFRFSEEELNGMLRQLARTDLPSENRVFLHFALGKAFGDAGRYAESFEHYAKGNAIYRLTIDDDPDVLTAHVAKSKTLLTREFFAERAGYGSAARDPIFIVGLPRAGSTLVEQILASHSAIEGIKELPDLMQIGRHLENRVAPQHGADYPGVLAKLDSAAFAELAERYLASTARHRKLGRPHFTDKMGSNFLHIGLIQLMFPNAKIVDARRHPMACCFSNFTQHFARALTYTYRLTDLGRCYRDYVDLMRHFDEVLPGRVHRLLHEALVEDPEGEIRRLLDYLELPFEEGCLHFHKTERVVTTVSSEQVRRPIFKDGVETWRRYEPWLGPLKRALGPALEYYPDAPPA